MRVIDTRDLFTRAHEAVRQESKLRTALSTIGGILPESDYALVRWKYRQAVRRTKALERYVAATLAGVGS